MSRFDECLAFVLDREGGYSNHVADRGGATDCGITQNTYDEWRERKGLPHQPVWGIGKDEVRAIYEEQYWNPVRGAICPRPLDLVLFDSAVNHGVTRAVMILQEVLGVEPKRGFFGPITLDAMHTFVAKYGLDALVSAYIVERQKFYDLIITNDPTQKIFAKGWANRLAALHVAVEA